MLVSAHKAGVYSTKSHSLLVRYEEAVIEHGRRFVLFTAHLENHWVAFELNFEDSTLRLGQ